MKFHFWLVHQAFHESDGLVSQKERRAMEYGLLIGRKPRFDGKSIVQSGDEEVGALVYWGNRRAMSKAMGFDVGFLKRGQCIQVAPEKFRRR
jgi:hypothetical protein